MRDFKSTIDIALHQIYELNFNLINVAVRIDQESKKLSYSGQDNYSSTLYKSAIFFQYTLFEALVNFLKDITTNLNNNQFENAPETVKSLSEKEIDFLNDQREVNDNGIKKKITQFNSTSDKLKKVPKYLSSLIGDEKSIALNCIEWQHFQDLEEIRNRITHPIIDYEGRVIDSSEPIMDFSAIKPIVTIAENNLFNGIIAMRWYIRELVKLLESLNSAKMEPLIKGLVTLDMFNRIAMISLSKVCGTSQEEIDKKFPVIGKQRYS